ncbi:peptidoglycan editing factor PgeF [bacterium]|nr:peptidoglycan editing factor PgeF [bacterium]
MFYFDSFLGKKVLKSTLLDGIDHFFTTREFPLTYADREDLKEEAEQNRKKLTEEFKIKALKTAKQTHSDHIQIVKENQDFYDDTDALISNIENSAMILNFADCTPIILYSYKDNAGALVHAGWRGTEKEIVYKTVLKMEKELNVEPKNLTAVIGPAIGIECFEVSEEVFNKLIKPDYPENTYKIKDGKFFCDLKQINKFQIESSGVVKIDRTNYCTSCMSDIFFSYRKENGKTARHSSILKIRG